MAAKRRHRLKQLEHLNKIKSGEIILCLATLAQVIIQIIDVRKFS
jgi:hypothetical protein